MTKKQLIIGAAVVTIFVVAAIAWTTRYEYRNGPSVCMYRIDRWTGNVELGCRGSEWRKVGEKVSSKPPPSPAPTNISAVDGAQQVTSGQPLTHINASDDELLAIFDKPDTPSPTASEAEKAFRDATYGKAAKSAESQLFGARPLADR